VADSEFELIRKAFFAGLKHNSTRVSNGDDASVHTLDSGMGFAVSTDTSLAGVHWPEGFPLQTAADRAVCSALSDMAAMGACAQWCWVSVMLPDAKYGIDLGKGIRHALARHHIELAGGDTVQSTQCGLHVTVAGVLPQGESMQRNLAVAGDDVWLIGKLGYAALGLQEWLQGERDGIAVEAFSHIQPLLSEGVTLREMGVRCCIDISDGLLQDAKHLCEASSVAFHLELSSLPHWQTMIAAHGEDQSMQLMLAGGDDYALLFTAPPSLSMQLDALAIHIGKVQHGSTVQLTIDGSHIDFCGKGFDHFA